MKTSVRSHCHLAVIGALLLSCVAVATVVSTSTSTASQPRAGAGSLSGVNVFGSGFDRPDAIAVGAGHVWVANANGNSVTEMSSSTGAVVQILAGSSYGFNLPDAIVAGSNHAWVANANGNTVTEISTSTGASGLTSGSSWG